MSLSKTLRLLFSSLIRLLMLFSLPVQAVNFDSSSNDAATNTNSLSFNIQVATNLNKKLILSLLLTLLLLPSLQAAQTCTTSQIAAVDFDGISGSSDNNVVAAGENGEVYIYDGTNWSTNPITVPGNPNEDLEDVSVINANASVVVGKNGTVLLQDSGTWSTLAAPTGEDLKAVWAYSTTNFYVFGKKGTVYYYDGSWNDLSGAAATGNNDDFEDAWGNGTYLYGLTKAGELFQLTLGGSWATINTCAAAANQDIKSLWGDAAGNLYLAGKGGDVFYYELSSGNCTQLSTSASEDLEGIYGSAATGEIYAVGKNGVVFFGTTNGATTTLTETTVGSEDFKAVWLTSGGNAYYGGKNGFTSTCTYTATPPVAACSTTTIASNEDLNGISGSSDSNVVAAGKNGEVYIYDGTNWSTNPITVPGNPNEDLEDVSVINANSSVVVGKNGAVLLQDSGTWSTLAAPTGEDLKAVWAYSTTNFYVFGKKGTVYYYDGSWNDLSGAAGTGNNDDFEDAWGNGTYLYGLTKAGDLYQLTLGGGWATITTCATTANQDIKSLWGDAAGNLYLAGKGGDVFYYELSSGNCTQLSTSASEDLEGIYGSAATGEIYAVGKNGTIFSGTTAGATTTLTETTVGNEDFRAVWVSTAGIPYYAGKGGTLTICSQASPLHHIRILHDGEGLTCDAEQVTVKACVDANCTAEYTTGSVIATLTPDGDAVTFTGNTLANVRQSTVGIATLGATITSTPIVPVRCFNGATETCSMNFVNSGFRFTDGANPPNPITIGTQIAGKASNVNPGSQTTALQAVRTDTNTGACVGVFADGADVNVEMASQCNNPTTCITASKVSITNNSITTAINNNPNTGVSSYSSVLLRFTTNSQAILNFAYPDVGQITFYARYNIPDSTGIPTGNYMSGNSNAFIVKPSTFVVSNILRADNTVNPANTSSTDTPYFVKASADFKATAEARDINGNITPNYGNELTPEGVLLTPALVAGLGLTNNPAIINNTLAGTEFGSTGAVNDADGVASVINLSWPEVGIITITASVADNDYLGAGSVTGTTTGNVGRFVPHHFDTVVSDSCSAVFTYAGQPFTVQTKAMNNLATPTVTQNYHTGSFSKAVTLSTASTVAGSFGTTGDIAASDFTTGTFIKTDVSYTFTAKDSGPDAMFTVRATDTDSVTSNDAAANEGSTDMRSGRTRLENVFGSELVDHNVPSFVEYFDGSEFVTNTTDTCTTLSATLTDIGTDTVTVGDGSIAGNTCIWDDDSESGTDNCTDASLLPGLVTSQFEEPPVAGSFNLFLRAPGVNFTGDIGVTLTSPTWLQYDWDGDTNHDNDPTGTVSFGLYRGDDRIIYWREVF